MKHAMDRKYPGLEKTMLKAAAVIRRDFPNLLMTVVVRDLGLDDSDLKIMTEDDLDFVSKALAEGAVAQRKGMTGD